MAILDTTLREGEQRFGVYFRSEVRVRLALFLHDIGVEELEIGVVRMDKELYSLWRTLKKKGLGDKLSLWCKLHPKDISLAQTFSGIRLNLSVPVSPLHLKYKLRISQKELLARINTLVPEARRHFSFVSLGLEDASRTPKRFLFQVIRTAIKAGVRRIRLSDTLSFWNPLQVAELVKEFKNNFPDTELGLHLHNDLGMATGNAVAALESGADWVDTTLLGLGERAGITPLEELIAYLVFRRGEKRYQIKILPLAAHFVSWHAGETLSAFKPVLGRSLFFCESGLHVDGIYKNRKLYEPFPPEVLGLSHQLALGVKSGQGAVKAKLKELGITVSEEDLPLLLQRIRELAAHYSRPLSDAEVKRLCEEFTTQNRRDSKPQINTKLTYVES